MLVMKGLNMSKESHNSVHMVINFVTSFYLELKSLSYADVVESRNASPLSLLMFLIYVLETKDRCSMHLLEDTNLQKTKLTTIYN